MRFDDAMRIRAHEVGARKGLCQNRRELLDRDDIRVGCEDLLGVLGDPHAEMSRGGDVEKGARRGRQRASQIRDATDGLFCAECTHPVHVRCRAKHDRMLHR